MVTSKISSYYFYPRAWVSLIKRYRVEGSPNCSPEEHSTFRASMRVLADAASSRKISSKLLRAISRRPFLWYSRARSNFSIASSCFQFSVGSSFWARARASMMARLSWRLASRTSEPGRILSRLLMSSLKRQMNLVLASPMRRGDAILRRCSSSWKRMVPSPACVLTNLMASASCSDSWGCSWGFFMMSMEGKILRREGVMAFFLFLQVAKLALEGPTTSKRSKKSHRQSSSVGTGGAWKREYSLIGMILVRERYWDAGDPLRKQATRSTLLLPDI